MNALVTGVAGFIGSTLAEEMLAGGHAVRGADALTPYYDTAIKRSNLDGLRHHPRFELHEIDLLDAPLEHLLDGVDVVFHTAAQPGVRSSWGKEFALYERRNVLVTQRLLEAVRDTDLTRFVYSSSLSVYGSADRYPTTEQDLPRPESPYGVTKLAAEHLCNLYARNFGVPTVSLRYFTIYGPRQRPDMAFHRLVEAALSGSPFPLYGTGRQVRDFTYVADAVGANVQAATTDAAPGTVVNIAGGSAVALRDVIDLVGEITGRSVAIDLQPAVPGDVQRTGGSIDAAGQVLHWKPEISLEEGLRRQVEWHAARRR